MSGTPRFPRLSFRGKVSSLLSVFVYESSRGIFETNCTTYGHRVVAYTVARTEKKLPYLEGSSFAFAFAFAIPLEWKLLEERSIELRKANASGNNGIAKEARTAAHRDAKSRGKIPPSIRWYPYRNILPPEGIHELEIRPA